MGKLFKKLNKSKSMANKSKAALVGVLSQRDSVLPTPNMKRSQLTTTLLQQEEDVLVSKNSSQKGLQQYFTPLKIGTWMRHILDQKTGLVVDLTAGAGNLLMPWVSNQNVGDKSLGFETMQALGVELDKENIPKSTTFLNVVNANIAELYPLLLQVEFHADVFVLNPPFTLFWHIPELTNSEDKSIESQLATVKMAIEMTKHRGQGAFLVAKSAWDKSLSQDEEIAQYVHSAVVAKNLFLPYANVDCVICFYVKTGKRGYSSQYEDIAFDLESPTVDRDLVAAARKVKSERQYYSMYPELWSSEETTQDHRDRFLAAATEYKALKKKKQQAHNIEYKGGRIKVYLSNFQRFTLLKDFTYEENALVEKMHGLSPSYFAFNTQDRRALFKLVDERKLLTMDEAARKAITDAVSNAEFILTPMYELKPQQRLGYLEEIDKIRCIKSGIRRFEERTVALRKDEEYDVKVTSATIESWYEKETGASGVSKDMVKLVKALNIDVGGAAFGESGDDITFLIDHFEIPDPRDVRDKKPKLYDRIRRRIESDEFKQFTFRGFQVEDLTRLSMKPSAVLSWEQGLGKCARGDTMIEVNGQYRRMDSLNYSHGVFDGEGYWSKPKDLMIVDSFDDRTGRMVRKPVTGMYREWIDSVIEEVELNDGTMIPKTIPHKLYNGIEWESKIGVGDFVAVPAKTSPGECDRDEDTLELLAYMIGEGYDRSADCHWEITQKNVEVLNRLVSHGIPCDNQRIVFDKKSGCSKLILQGKDFQRYAFSLGLEPDKRSKDKRLPQYIMSAKNANIFLRHYFDAEGCASKDSVQLTSASRELIEQIRLLLRRYGVWGFVKKKRKSATNGRKIMRDYWDIVVSGDDVVPFACHIGFNDPAKQEKLMSLVSRHHNTNVNVLPTRDVLIECPIGKRRSGIDGNRYRTANASKEATLRFIERLRPFNEASDTVEKLVKLVRQEVRYAQVKEVRRIRYTGWVYDLEIGDTHSFVANGIICHNTRGALAWLKVRYVKKALIICPQDLKKQWTSEARDLGVQLFEIQGYRDLQNIKKEKSGIWLIHYELLKGTRRRDRLVEEFGKAVVVKHDHRDEDVVKNFNALCPNCKALRQDGWNGYSCKKCQYHVWTQRVKPMYSYLKHAFDGIVIDEGVKIKSKHSQQGIAGRSLHAKNRLLLSGSPIKGWITDAFWLLHWTLGNATPRFPYHYVGGTEKFLDDFGVWEYVGEEFKKSLSKGKKKLLPEIGNLHLLWKLFAPSIIRRVKADTGETMVAKNVHRIKVQFTKSQKETYDWWIGNFTEWYEASHITEMDDNAIAMREMILGLLWKLRITATVPASRLLPGVPMSGKEDTFFEGKQGDSNYTQKALFVLQKLKEITEKGEQAVVFSSLQDNQRFLFQLCTRFGIKAVVANAETPPEKRGYIMADFKHRKFLVLIAGTQAVNLGHNLDNANHVFMTDYEWDHSTTRQAIDRVHRFTSKKDVNVYLLYTEGGIDYRQLFEIIDRKGQSSDLALDGKLLDEAEEQIDFFKIAREIMRDHKRGTEGLLAESEIEDKMVSMFVKNRAVVMGEEHAHAVERSVPRITLRVVEIKDQLEMHF